MVQEVTIWKVFLPPPGLLMALNDYVTNILGSKANVRVFKTLLHHRGNNKRAGEDGWPVSP